MIISSHPLPKTPRCLHAFILLFAVALLPLGVARAQDPDYDAVGRRIRAAVQAGELTPEQGRIMLDALRKSGAKKKKTDVDAGALRRRLAAAVESGRMTREEAGKILEREMAGRKQEPGYKRGEGRKLFTREDYASAQAKIKKAVESGQLSKEDARKKLGVLRKRLAAGARGDRDRAEQDRAADKAKEYLARVRKALGEELRAGKISREEFAERWEAIQRRVKERLSEARRRDAAPEEENPGAARAKAYLQKVREDLADAVRAGKISKEDAAERYKAAAEGIKKRMAGAKKRKSKEKDSKDDDKRRRRIVR